MLRKMDPGAVRGHGSSYAAVACGPYMLRKRS